MVATPMGCLLTGGGRGGLGSLCCSCDLGSFARSIECPVNLVKNKQTYFVDLWNVLILSDSVVCRMFMLYEKQRGRSSRLLFYLYLGR